MINDDKCIKFFLSFCCNKYGALFISCVLGPIVIICFIIKQIITFPWQLFMDIKYNYSGLFSPSWIRQCSLREYFGFKELGYWKEYYTKNEME